MNNDFYNNSSGYDENYLNNPTPQPNQQYPKRSQYKPPKPKNSKKQIALEILKWSTVGFICLIVMCVGLFAFYAKDAPNVTQEELQAGGSSALYTNDGKLLLSLGSDKRNYLKSDQIPQQLKDAVISIEDRHFYSESLGISPLRIASSAVQNVMGHNMAGGSTLTQQLIKLSVFSTKESDRTLKRKAQEAWLAVKISHQYSKDQILEFYVNKVFMNYNIYGMGTAANFYYGKSISKLDLAQTALIAGMPNAPVSFDPYLYPEQATKRRNLVLAAMLDNKKITQDQYDKAIKENIKTGLKEKHDTGSRLRRIDDPYIKEVINETRADGFDPYRDNLKIYVNINQKAQNELYNLANKNVIPFTNNKMQAAATVIDPDNGHVIAILGGRHLPNIQLGLDRAVQTDRSTGSSIKPILDYAPAIEYLNWSTAQVLEDTPYTYKGTNIKLYDWDDRFMGKMTMRYALEQSRNVPAVRTLEEVGINRGAKFAKKLGIKVKPSQGLSVAIGANASTLQMTGAFSALDNDGIYHKPQFVSKIEAPDGTTRNYDNNGTRVMKSSTAYMITDMLKDVIKKGSGKDAMINNVYQAGKTGTVKYSDGELAQYPSYDGTPKDSWFVGYSPDYCMGVWTGYDKLSDGKIDKTGEKSAMLLYKAMMQYLMKNKVSADWSMPDTVVKQAFTAGNVTTQELYVKGHVPEAPKVNQKIIVKKNPNDDQDDSDSQDKQKDRGSDNRNRKDTDNSSNDSNSNTDNSNTDNSNDSSDNDSSSDSATFSNDNSSDDSNSSDDGIVETPEN